MGDKHIQYTYYNTLTTKSSPSTFEFHGKSNTPNVVLTTGNRMKQYISRIVSINEPTETNFDGELVIEHTLTTNYGKKMILIFPLKTDETIRPNIIDKMIHANPGDTLEVNLNTVISREDSCQYKDDNNIAIFATPILIKTRILKKNEPIIEGVCPNDEETAATLATINSRLDDLDKHITDTSKHSVVVGGPSESDAVKLNDVLANSNLQCDALPMGEEGNDYIAQLLDINVDNNIQKLDLTNPIAYFLAFIIAFCVVYFTLTAGYKKLFMYLLYNNHNDNEPSLKSLHMYEGVFGFILFWLFFMFLQIKNPIPAGLLLSLWLIYSLVIGVSKKGIIVDVAGSSYELDDQIKQIMKSTFYNMVVFYPFFLLIFGFEKAKQWSS